MIYTSSMQNDQYQKFVFPSITNGQYNITEDNNGS